MKTTEQKIKEKESELQSLKLTLIEEKDKSNWIKIPTLKIEIQNKIHHKNKSYDELKEEFGEDYLENNLPTYAQLQYLRYSKEYCKKLGLINTWEFVKQEDLIAKKKGRVARFVANSGGLYLNTYWDSVVSDSDLGVRFVRKIKGDKK